MHAANQDDPHENRIRMLVIHLLFWPDEKRWAEIREELIGMVSENPSKVERVVLAYAKSLLQVKEAGLGWHSGGTDGRRPCDAFDECQQRKLLELLKDVRREAQEARMGRVRDRKEIYWAREYARKSGSQVSMRIH